MLELELPGGSKTEASKGIVWCRIKRVGGCGVLREG